MSTPMLIPLPGAQAAAAALAGRLGAPLCRVDSRRFPDDELYLRVADDVRGRELAIVASLRQPDAQAIALRFLADDLRALGAARVGLIAPYLPYMRQDARFQAGEAITSLSFSAFVSASVDWLLTVDPHLHRHASLDEIYSIPATIVPAAPSIAQWVRRCVSAPLIVGPDEESEPWAAEVARGAACRHVVLRKQRRGDRDVEIELPAQLPLRGITPVLVDDIVSSARTMAVAVRRLREAGATPPVCIAVHPLFTGDAFELLSASGVARIVSCNTLAHPSNQIDVLAAVADAVPAAAAAQR